MIKVVAKFIIKQGMTDRFLAAVPNLITGTNKEAGCIAYDLYQDLHDSNTFAMIEEWGSQEALDKHMKSKHFLEIKPLMDEVLEKEEVNLLRQLLKDPAYYRV